jgi:circadian clock protein KaiC
MKRTSPHSQSAPIGIGKSLTGIRGLDEITGGGLPAGRPTLVCGNPGCGKTLLAIEFLVRGAMVHSEPGVCVTFEESAAEITDNVASLGFDLRSLVAKRKLQIDYVHVERSEIEETGTFDLDGLFVRLAHSITSIGAKRVVLDTIESLFTSLPNEMILRAELRRLFGWLKDKGVTAIITAERGDGTLTRHGLEEYISDCVILLDHRVTEQISTRRLRVVKYRGSLHGTNEYPFLIDRGGIVVLPITSVGLDNRASTRRISSGVPRLDAMLGGKGFYCGSTILVSGTGGTGKTSLAVHFASAACERRERTFYFAFEESVSQIARNMRSIGIDLRRFVKEGRLRFFAARPTAYGLETHLATMHRLIDDFKPSVAILDPISNLAAMGPAGDVSAALIRLIDFLKNSQVTCMCTSLTVPGTELEHTAVGVSSLVDTWLLLRDIESRGERNRGLCILKSRGMAHSNQIREFHLTTSGVQLTDVYLGPAGVLTGAARAVREARDQAETLTRQHEIERKQRQFARKRQVLEARIELLRGLFADEEDDLMTAIDQERARQLALIGQRTKTAGVRRADQLLPALTTRSSARRPRASRGGG